MQVIYKLPAAYYRFLLETELIEEILSHFEDHEKEEVIFHLMESLDHAILAAILSFLEEHLHEEFLSMLENRYHDPELIDWLEEQKEGITPRIQTVARETKIAIIKIIDNKADTEN